ncbi:MAG: putative double-glycine peptidase [Verrucomicrobiales bacterium]|jgi:predicted double-glycine peptidase
MTIHPMLIPTLALAVAAFVLGLRLSRNWNRIRGWRTAVFIGSCCLGIPGAFFAFYYTHLLDDWVSLYRLRALPGSELAFGVLALPAGMLSGRLGRIPRILFATLAVAAAFLPFVKPILAPLDYSSMTERWNDGVCIQSSAATCGPSSATTILAIYGDEEITEQLLAREAYSYQGGTECWHLARAVRKRGFEVDFAIYDEGLPQKIDTPIIAGVRLGDIGHFITILEQNGDELVIGDPLSGRKTASRAEFQRSYKFTGFFMSIRPR